MTDYISREALLERVCEVRNKLSLNLNNPFEDGVRIGIENVEIEIENLPTADVRPVPEGGIGEMSDGYHTFNGLYYQRMVLFAALVKVYKGMAWKSWRHEDGELCFGKDNYFIVGIDTPKGSYTYHYHGEHWDLFDCEELPVAKHWDGHTEKDVTRLLSLDVRPVVRGKWKYNQDDNIPYCSECMMPQDSECNFCPNCGADMRKDEKDER